MAEQLHAAAGADVPVRVRYFAAAVDAAGCEEEVLSLPAGATLGDLRALLEALHGEAMRRTLRRGSFLVDAVVSRDPDRPIGSNVDILPPFAGG